MEIRKISRRCSLSFFFSFGHFTFLFSGTKIYNERAQLLFFSLNLLFGELFVTFVLVVRLSSPYRWKQLWIFKRECPRSPHEITKMWHMLEKLISLISRLEIPHDELINMVYLFCSDLCFFPRKFAKIVRDANRYKMVDIRAPSTNTRTSRLKSAKASLLFFFLSICVGGIGKWFRPKTRILHLILNLRYMFKNQQYFMVLKSNFGAFFQDTFFLCGIAPNHLRLMSWLVEMFFFSRI